MQERQRQTDRQTNRQTDRKRERETEREKETERDRETQREKKFGACSTSLSGGNQVDGLPPVVHNTAAGATSFG